jgi:cation transport ATPase
MAETQLEDQNSTLLDQDEHEVKENKKKEWYADLESKSLWLFMVVAIVVLFILYYLSIGTYGSTGYWSQLQMWSWGQNPTLLGFLLVIAVLIFTWGCWNAYVHIENKGKKNMIIAGFGLSMILLIVWFALFFTKSGTALTTKGFNSASYAALFASLVALLTLYVVWNGGMVARVSVIIYTVYIIILTILFFNIARNNN